MSHETVHPRSMQAWLAVAMFAPLAHYCGGSWPVLLVLSMLAVGLMGFLPENPEPLLQNRFLCAVELVWVLVLAGHYLPLSAEYWPGEKSELVVPAALLLLGAYSCTGRPDRTGGVLFCFLVLMLVPFALAAVKDADPEWLIPERMDCDGWVVPILLLPAAAFCFVEGERKGNIGWICYLPAIGIWSATCAVLSPNIASGLETPFRELSRSLTLGAGSRFESLAGVLITLGWFALASLLIRLSSNLLQAFKVKGTVAPWLAAALAIGSGWLDVQRNPAFSAGMTLFLWVLVPILHCKKISKKSEKSA